MSWGTKLLCLLVLLAAGWCSVCVFVLQQSDPYDAHGGVIPMLAGTSERPFVNRALLPTAARLLSGGHIDEHARSLPPGDGPFQIDGPKGTIMVLLRGWGLDPVHQRPVQTLLDLMVVCYAAFGAGMLLLIRRFTGWPVATSLLLALLAMAVPCYMSMTEPRQVYDPSTLAFAPFLTYLGLSRRQAPFLVLLAVAFFAKESLAILSLLLILPAIEERDWKRVATVVGIVAIEYLVVQKLIVGHFYGHNPGSSFELTYEGRYNFMDNLRMLTFTSKVGIHAWSRMLIAVVPLGIALWRSSPATRRLVLLVTLFHTVSLFVVGRLQETRVFFELLPLWLLVAAPTVLRWLGTPTEPVEIATPPPPPVPARAV